MVQNAQVLRDIICHSKLETKVKNSLYMNGFGYTYIEKQSVDNANTCLQQYAHRLSDQYNHI